MATIRSLTTNLNYFKKRRLVHTLSNGRVVVVVQDGTALHIYESTDRVNFTLRVSYTISTTIHLEAGLACTVDSTDNLHVTWVAGANADALRYLKFTYNGLTWTAGTNESVQLNLAGVTFGAPDIEVLNGGMVVLAVVTTGGSSSVLRTYARPVAGGWVAHTAYTLVSVNSDVFAGMVTIARDEAGSASASQRIAFMAVGGIGAAPILGSRLISTAGAVTATTVIDAAALGGSEGSAVRGRLFSVAGSTWRGLFWAKERYVWAFECDQTKYTISPKSFATSSVRFETDPARTERDTAMGKDRGLFVVVTSARYAQHCFARFKDGTITFSANSYQWVDSNGIGWLQAGSNRNLQLGNFDVLHKTGNVVEHVSNSTPPAPSSVTPTHLSTQPTDTPTLGMGIVGAVNSRTRFKAYWVLASDSAFTTELRVVEEPDDFLRPRGQTTFVLPDSQQLNQKTWYIRGHQIDEFGTLSAAYLLPNPDEDVGGFVTQQFISHHPPAALRLSPANNVYRNSGAVVFTWEFSDSSVTDHQTAFRIEVQRTDGTSVLDTGKIVRQGSSHTAALADLYKDQALRWRVTVWDSSDVASAPSSFQLFKIGDPPTVVISQPATGVDTLDNPQPTIAWSTTFGGTRTQKQFRLTFRTKLEGNLVYDSGWVASASFRHAPPRPILERNQEYSVRLEIEDTAGFVTVTTRDFLTAWVPPAAPSAVVSDAPYSEQGYVRISWTNANKDSTFVAWRVKRRRLNGDWVVLTEIESNQSEYEYQDWFVGAGKTYDYVVVQVAERFGSFVESSHSAPTRVKPVSTHYWLVHPTDVTKSKILYQVTGDSFSEEYEEEEVIILDRGRHVDRGTRLGYKGQINAQLWDRGGVSAHDQRLALEEMVNNEVLLYLRSPFGDLWPVHVSNVQVARKPGVGLRDFADITLNYAEIV